MNDRYLSVDQVAELLGTTARFPRRLIEERRIRYVKVGRHVRIPESAVRDYLAAHTVEPVGSRRAGLRRAA
ncbi:excisionase family DNA-binding protein [Streptomyces pseudogriseolus]|uniref:excisionase family DNA-binding protein n=1 Tax=Streptomyces TaxID=1883 RepID=UPI00193B27D0|nr:MULTISPECIES: excisionase family DNA-binding protein [Streptomyces]MDI6514740.1 excisionase family DNA-binding protein [Streptomyces coelicoflavus]